MTQHETVERLRAGLADLPAVADAGDRYDRALRVADEALAAPLVHLRLAEAALRVAMAALPDIAGLRTAGAVGRALDAVRPAWPVGREVATARAAIAAATRRFSTGRPARREVA